jgi:hypothetical protein
MVRNYKVEADMSTAVLLDNVSSLVIVIQKYDAFDGFIRTSDDQSRSKTPARIHFLKPRRLPHYCQEGHTKMRLVLRKNISMLVRKNI